MLVDVEKEVELYQKELNEGKFRMESLENSAEDYSKTKEARDEKAFKEFVKTDTFRDFMDWKESK